MSENFHNSLKGLDDAARRVGGAADGVYFLLAGFLRLEAVPARQEPGFVDAVQVAGVLFVVEQGDGEDFLLGGEAMSRGVSPL